MAFASQFAGATRESMGDTYARLTREMWANYIQNFVPIENELIDYATNPDTVTNAVAAAREDVAASFEAQKGSTQRRLFGLGVNLRPDEQESFDRSTEISKSLADVNAANMTARQTRERQQSILGSPVPSVGA